jgi:hypothetical protein
MTRLIGPIHPSSNYSSGASFLPGRAPSLHSIGPVHDLHRPVMAANVARPCGSEQVVAVWDGQPADGRGATGDVVVAARERVEWTEGRRYMSLELLAKSRIRIVSIELNPTPTSQPWEPTH